jgi:Bacterial Ig-like domain
MPRALFHLCFILTGLQFSACWGQQRQTFDIGNQKITVELAESEDSATFAIRGFRNLQPLSDQLKDAGSNEFNGLFAVKVASDMKQPPSPSNSSNALPALSGRYEFIDNGLQFTTRYPLNPRVQYSVEISSALLGDNAASKKLLFTPNPQPQQSTSRVVAIYPTSDTLPENLLKFYIHFSGPMSRGEAYGRIHLMHGEVEVKDPFLELGEELWDRDQQRFTLFVHPGRIKRGVKPREDDGLPMTNGNEYRLLIDAQWLDADRRPLAKAFEKKFKIVAADEQQPSPERWKIETPKAGTQSVVMLTFNEPMDHAMLQRVLTVRDSRGKAVEGKVDIANQETQWLFTPNKQWNRGTYAIEIATNLEDLCGNSIARPFETALQTDVASVEAPRLIAVEFTVAD